jgi:hypothetical protein
MAAGQWIKQQGLTATTYPTREDVFAAMVSRVRGHRVLYLEFGVWEGASMRTWSKLLEGEDAVLHGFDSFEGLPEAWNMATPAGHFSTDGVLPDIGDERVTFFPGWFSDTLLGYELPAHDRLVINFDADLYSSTAFVLDRLEPWIVPGTCMYFDEFANYDHELRALSEYVEHTGIKLGMIGATPALRNVAFDVVG